MTLLQLQNKVMKLLGEAQNSTAAAFLTGGGSTPVQIIQTSAEVITEHLNDAQDDLARNYYPISDTATYTWPAGQQFAKYSQFACQGNAGNIAFGVRKVNFGGVNLVSSGRAATENWYPNMDTDPQGEPSLYYEDGIEGFGVYPIPALATSVTGKVIITPAPLVLPGDIPIFPANLHVLLAWYAAAMVLLRNTEDPTLQSRGNSYMSLYLDRAKKILDRVWRLDPDFARDLMAANPAAAAAMTAGQG